MSCVFDGAIANRCTTERHPAPEPPALDTRDASALRSFIEAMISARAVACGSKQSAKRMAATRTIVRTCKLLGVEPRAHLRFVVRRLLAGERDPTVLRPKNFTAMVATTDAA